LRHISSSALKLLANYAANPVSFETLLREVALQCSRKLLLGAVASPQNVMRRTAAFAVSALKVDCDDDAGGSGAL
jgi:hypothetical protein